MRIKGDIIRSVRKQKKLSQVTLAAGICTQGTVSNIENKNVCDSLEIPVSYTHLDVYKRQM
nr:hypothetical protein A5881_003104 [Enterococcus termitis]